MTEQNKKDSRQRLDPTHPTCLSSYFQINKTQLEKRDDTYLFKDSKRPASGRVNDYFPGGQVRSQGGLIHGYKHGLWEHFYENGQLEYLCHYVRGKKDWYGEYYDENGDLSETEVRKGSGITWG